MIAKTISLAHTVKKKKKINYKIIFIGAVGQVLFENQFSWQTKVEKNREGERES
jgi:hypothetical protein